MDEFSRGQICMHFQSTRFSCSKKGVVEAQRLGLLKGRHPVNTVPMNLMLPDNSSREHALSSSLPHPYLLATRTGSRKNRRAVLHAFFGSHHVRVLPQTSALTTRLFGCSTFRLFGCSTVRLFDCDETAERRQGRRKLPLPARRLPRCGK